MNDVLAIAVTPVALITGTLVGSRRLRLDRRTGLGLQLPSVKDTVLLSTAFLVLLVLAEAMYSAAGSGAQSDWRAKYGPGALALRVVFASAIYPIAEELFFRGLLLGAIRRRAGPIVATLATAALFTALHSLGGSWLGALQIFVDGVFFAYVRLRSGSLLLPVVFHVVGNCFAVMQRL
jgi:membrane protease YdiL (CAAX protease family)